MNTKRREIFAFVIILAALAGVGVGCYHVGYKDGYISALRQMFAAQGFNEPAPAPQKGF